MHWLETRRGRMITALVVAVLLALGAAWVAFADNLVNNLDTTVDPALETITITVGSQVDVGFYIEPTTKDGDAPGCNATGNEPAYLTITPPSGVTATPVMAPTFPIKFVGCKNVEYVTFSSNTPGTYTISDFTMTGGKEGSKWNYETAKFTLVVKPLDSTPPVITPNVLGTLGNNGWYVSDVTVSWTVVDNESPITSKSGCDSTTINYDTAGVTLTCTATSAGGTSSQSVTIKRDATPPSITASRSPEANAYGWNNTDVTVSFSCSDALSGIDVCPADVVVSTEGAGQSVTGTAMDQAGNTASAAVSDINIDKTAPTLSNLIASPNPAPVNTLITFSATVGDNLSGLARVVYEHSVDGGSTWTPLTAASEPWTASISFDAAHVVLVRAHAEDKAGNVSGEDAILLAVYDPSGGFVTGGGWIMSPAGAYAANPSLTGKATFGFVAKYQKGANVPVGNTEFQFHVANFKFKSTEYEWLVVAGARAQFKGSGTVNGVGGYGFMLTAIDGQLNGGGGVDKFRIKIWDKATGDIVYDNQMGAGDAADPTTAVMGGSIVIHK